MSQQSLAPLREPARPRRLAAALTGALVTVLALAAWAGVPPQSPAEAAPARASARPNIVVVMADDMRADDLRFMSAVRRLVVRTGLTFRNSFSPYPLCCPARASFLTGRYAHNHRVFSHKSPWGFKSFDDRRTLATALRSAGYRTGFVGKYLNGYGAQRSLVTGRSSLRYVPNGWSDWYGAVRGTYNYWNTTYNVNGRLDRSHHGEYQTNVLGGFARTLVTRYHRLGRPFFLYFSSVAPHFGGPYEKGDPVRVRRRDGSYTKFATPARPASVRGMFNSRIRRASGLPVDGSSPEADISDKARPMRWLSQLSTAERIGVRNLTRQRAEALYVLDRQVAQLIARLKATGEYRNTVFVFTSDNGYFLGEHRVREGKIKPHEPSLRVPLVITGRGIRHGERFDPATTPGLTATIAQLAGARSRMPFVADGVSLVPSLRADRGWAVPVVTEGRESSAVFPKSGRAPGFHDARTTIGVRTGQWKYVEYSSGDKELYDLDADPNELHNLAGDPALAQVRDQLRLVWSDYKDCRGLSCRTSLPTDLRRAPGENAAATNQQSRGVRAVFGYWR
jgi:arylsulfatase A-like enzyme